MSLTVGEALDAMRSGQVRAAWLQEQQASFYDGHGAPRETLGRWQQTLDDREAHDVDEAWSGGEEAKTEIVAAVEMATTILDGYIARQPELRESLR